MIFPSCLNIYNLHIGYMDEGIDAVVEINRLKKLKYLIVSGRKARDFKEVTLLIIRTMEMLFTSS